jgi:hypothetical protein
MFNKKVEIDEIELGAELYLKHLKESKQACTAQSNMIEASQEPETVYTEPSEDIPERAEELTV